MVLKIYFKKLKTNSVGILDRIIFPKVGGGDFENLSFLRTLEDLLLALTHFTVCMKMQLRLLEAIITRVSCCHFLQVNVVTNF